MTRNEALDILTQYNAWRRSHYDADPRPLMPRPNDIGHAIDVAIETITAFGGLVEQLTDVAIQSQCGCGHPACRQCRMDRETQRELRAAAEGEHGA